MGVEKFLDFKQVDEHKEMRSERCELSSERLEMRDER
jgi:hypothetical protein